LRVSQPVPQVPAYWQVATRPLQVPTWLQWPCTVPRAPIVRGGGRKAVDVQAVQVQLDLVHPRLPDRVETDAPADGPDPAGMALNVYFLSQYAGSMMGVVRLPTR
jgi:hypothetical protein